MILLFSISLRNFFQFLSLLFLTTESKIQNGKLTRIWAYFLAYYVFNFRRWWLKTREIPRLTQAITSKEIFINCWNIFIWNLEHSSDTSFNYVLYLYAMAQWELLIPRRIWKIFQKEFQLIIMIMQVLLFRCLLVS